MAEYIITLVINGLVSAICIGIGISQIKSKNPVGFYTHERAPRRQEITDVEKWNKQHGHMWIMYGIVILGVHILFIWIKDAMVTLALWIGAIIVPLPIMMWYHAHLKKMYHR